MKWARVNLATVFENNMKPHFNLKLAFCVGVIFWSASGLADPVLKVATDRTNAIYKLGETIEWHVQALGDDAFAIKDVHYILKEGGGKIIGKGQIPLQAGTGNFQASLSEPGTILAEVSATNANHRLIRVLAGAAVAPEKIGVSSPCPEDFDSFWQGKLKELAAVPENAILEKENSGRAGVDYWKITLGNIRGTHVQGQLARPAKAGKFPALLVLQWAGIYPLDKATVTGLAANGWLVLNIMAHDLPIDRPAAFYDDLTQHALTNYPAIGNDDREKSYFLRMFLGCYRAVEYLSERPDWNGKTLAATGVSQGGLQSFVAAGLNPKVTAVMVLVPAGCDHTGALAGRAPGWPYWMANVKGKDAKKALETSRYFDGVNFAARIKCPALIGFGLIDTTATPSGVLTAANQIHAPKELVMMPDADHHGHDNTHAPYMACLAAWRAALLAGNPPPVKKGMGD